MQKAVIVIAATFALVLLPPAVADAQTPTPGAYQGRVCERGSVINDFVILGDREEVPSCVVPFVPDGAADLLGLSPIPANLRLRGIEQSTEDGRATVSVVYDGVVETSEASQSPAGRSSVSITYFADGLSKPFPISLLITSQASPADFLPAPGVLLEPSAAVQIGYWFTESGLYRMTVEAPDVPLEIRELSGLLRVMTAERIRGEVPRPPATGSGLASPPSSASTPFLVGVVLVAGLILVTGWALGFRAASRLRGIRKAAGGRAQR